MIRVSNDVLRIGSPQSVDHIQVGMIVRRRVVKNAMEKCKVSASMVFNLLNGGVDLAKR